MRPPVHLYWLDVHGLVLQVLAPGAVQLVGVEPKAGKLMPLVAIRDPLSVTASTRLN